MLDRVTVVAAGVAGAALGLLGLAVGAATTYTHGALALKGCDWQMHYYMTIIGVVTAYASVMAVGLNAVSVVRECGKQNLAAAADHAAEARAAAKTAADRAATKVTYCVIVCYITSIVISVLRPDA